VIEPKSLWRNNKTTQEYEIVGIFSQLKEIQYPTTICNQAGTLKKNNGERLHLCSNGYYIKSGTELGELVFYKGDTGDWARTVEDFLASFARV
jgi:hypothetical protein